MKATSAIGVAALVTAFSSTAAAHFRLQQPADALKTDDTGDPLGSDGTQKTNPCGAGTPSGAVTTVRAGSKLHVKLTETVGHGGHYRIALVPKLKPTDMDLPEPEVTLAAGQCDKAKVMSPVASPVLADGLFQHTQDEAESGKLWETDVTLPSQTGDATLQVIEFMAPHDPGCFYHHCAELKIVAANAPLPATDGGAGDGSEETNTPSQSTAKDDGCNVSSDAGAGAGSIGSMVLVGLTLVRRRSRKKG